jgi:hypothetical protein
MIAIDSNLLIYAQREGSREHRAAQRAIETASRDPRGWGIPLPCIAELWRAVTSPAVPAPSRADQVNGFLRVLIIEAGAVVWHPGEGFWQRLITRASGLGVYGQRVFDLQIALIAVEGGATEIWSHDSRFVTLPGLALHDPL